MQPVELISTGAELLSGRSLNRHAHTLGQCLVPLGFSLVRDTTVPDDIECIAGAVTDALGRAEVVVISGGLGPTPDDLTREAVAQVVGKRVITDPHVLEVVRNRYRQYGRRLTAAGERQAQIIEGARVLLNPVGAAPGLHLEHDGKNLFLLPGPPREFLALLEEDVLPWLEEQGDQRERPIEKVLMATGIGESDILTGIEKEGSLPDGISIAFCAAPARVEVRIEGLPERVSEVEQATDRVRNVLGDHLFAEERIGLEEAVGRLLAARGLTLATAESCTGGLIGDRITSVSGSSRYYTGGVIAYANEVKTKMLGVDINVLEAHGAVSEPVALGMAEGVRRLLGARIGLSVTGIAGPDGGTKAKPVGLVFLAVADDAGAVAVERRFPGDRSWIKEWSCQTGLDRVRRRILNLG